MRVAALAVETAAGDAFTPEVERCVAALEELEQTHTLTRDTMRALNDVHASLKQASADAQLSPR